MFNHLTGPRKKHIYYADKLRLVRLGLNGLGT